MELGSKKHDWRDVEGDDDEVMGDSVEMLGDGRATKRMFTGTSFDMPQQISRERLAG